MKFSESLKKNSYFQNVYKNGKSYANRFLVMYVMENHLERNRLGISVSKKVGNSVIRHHITRLVREAYRLQEERFNSGLDIVVIARVSAKNITYRETESALLHLGNLHHILRKQQQIYFRKLEKKMEYFEKNINRNYKVLQKIFVTFKNDKMPVLSNLFHLWITGNRKVWCSKRFYVSRVENIKM